MREKIGLLLIIFSLIILGLIYKTNINNIKDIENQLISIRESVEELKGSLEIYEETSSIISSFEDISKKFVLAHTNGDFEILKDLISDDIKLIEKEDKIYGIITYKSSEIELLLYDKNSKEKYSHMKIQGKGYLENEDKYIIHIREFYYYEDGSDVTPPTFLNLIFAEIDGVWKIVSFEFDV